MTSLWTRFASWLLTIAAGIATAMAASLDPGAAWLDQPTPSSWNRAGLSIPEAPQFAAYMDPRCETLVRPPETKEEHALNAAGWKLFGEYRGAWKILLIQATAGHDGMCRPLQYQAFAFLEGKYAGTLSPNAMNSRSDGSLVRTAIESNARIRAEYARYGESDPLCCPSRTTTVLFDVTRGNEPVIRPSSATTTPNVGAR